ncbi:uncharacterized protein LOC119439980 [Dermacentor silvarum]|uniref:uncharacterized protein LOC119439980 n=1 Tax=Dermacentor silvarum TaxID=543639 RepID=UPI002101BF6A|nr:uncharacterized protein LOC119439980 [Dermacentor silvarum]
MEEQGVIAKVKGPTEWSSYMVTVVKKDKVRICLDPIALNKALLREHYPMPTLEDVVPKLAGANVFSTLDAASGFWQIKLDDSSSKLCTMSTPYGRYRFLRMPFGIASAPEIFQAAMHRVLEGLPNVAVVMDDILLWGKTKQEHDHSLQLLLTRCREQNLRLNLKKCFFLQREVRYLGHVLSAEGLRVDAQRIQDILEMPTPKNSSQRSLQDLLAATNDDDTLVKLREYANTTWPLHKQEVPEPLRTYWAYRDEIHAQDGLVFRSNKVIREFRTTTAGSLNTWCSQIFSVHGLPRKLCTDNGPPFNSREFKDFLNTLGIDHITSSPYHPRSNGMTERAVQEAKKLLKKCSFKMPVFQMALLEWRNTPRDDVLQSPVQRLMGRQTRTRLPVPTSHLEPRTIPSDVVQGRLQDIRQRQRTYYNRGSRNLSPVMPGQQVTVYDTNQRTWSPAVVLRPADEHRSTIVQTEDGRELRRTREHLRLVDPQPEVSHVPEDGSSTEPPQELRRSTRQRREPCRYPQQEIR